MLSTANLPTSRYYSDQNHSGLKASIPQQMQIQVASPAQISPCSSRNPITSMTLQDVQWFLHYSRHVLLIPS